MAMLLPGLSLYSQNLEIEGSIKVTEMAEDVMADNVVVQQDDGTLGVRGLSTILVDADSTNEIQAFSVSATGDTLYLSKGNWIIVPGISEANEPPPPPLECVNPGDLVITEIMTNPESPIDDNEGEWIEIYNSTGSDIDIEGYTLSDGGGTHVINKGSALMVPAGGYITVGKSASANGGITHNYIYAGIVLNNSGDSFQINCDQVVIDHVPIDDSMAGRSHSLDPAHLNATDNNMLSNWCFTPEEVTFQYHTTNYGTPGASNGTCIPEN